LPLSCRTYVLRRRGCASDAVLHESTEVIGRRGSRKEPQNGDVDVRHDARREEGLRARGLCRVSDPNKVFHDDPTDMNADEISLPKQIGKIKDYCRRNNLVFTGVHWDVDDGRSPNRSGYMRLIEGGYKDEYDVIVVWMGDRLCRGTTGAGPLQLMWERTDRRICVLSTDDNFDMRSLAMFAWASGVELDNIRKRTTDARLARARRGEILSYHLPYWLCRGLDKKGHLLPDHADAFREVICRYMGGEGTDTLCKWLRAHAPTHQTKPSSWCPSTLVRSLKSKALYGVLEYSARKVFRVEDPLTGSTVVELRRKDDLSDPRIAADRTLASDIVGTPVPPLLHGTESKRLACAGCGLCTFRGMPLPSYEALQQHIGRRRLHRPNTLHYQYPLRKLVFCENCDTLMTARVQHSYYRRDAAGKWQACALRNPAVRLRCSGMHKTRVSMLPCRRQRDVNGRLVWEHVKTQISLAIGQPGILKAAARLHVDQQQLQLTNAAAVIAAEHLLERAKQDQIELFRSRRGYHSDVYCRLNLAIGQTIEMYESEVAHLTKAARVVSAPFGLPPNVEHLLRDGRVVIPDQLTEDDWREIVMLMVERIEVDSTSRPHVKWRVAVDWGCTRSPSEQQPAR
jgi:DNA invertase Pin-like site-specific DNA recombinase